MEALERVQCLPKGRSGDATCDADLRSPPSNHFEKLSGGLEGLHSIRINDQWRLVFAWDGSAASQLYIDDHSYR